jgi:single-stranded-DNA-specific exonuclease
MDDARWILAPERPESGVLAAELGLPGSLARVLANRGVCDAAAGRVFLFGGLETLHDPLLMKGMAAAAERIEKAVRDREKILVFGDYDVDGVLSVVMLVRALRSLGAEVDHFIPERLLDGYGIKERHAEVAAEKGARLVVSVDCGIKAVAFVERAREKGIDVVITDHHRPGEGVPAAASVLDPVLEDSGYPDRDLAGVGVVFKLIQTLLERAGRSAAAVHYLKLVAIGTVADVAALRGENRVFVKAGLRTLGEAANPGLKALLESCSLAGRPINEGDLGFRLGPRINAAGRMGRSELAVRLFFSESIEECRTIVAELESLNGLRQRTEEKILDEARRMVEERGLDKKYRCLILGSEGWHRGVIGIVASKLKDLYHRPVVLFAYEDGRAYGSGRSISECALIELFDACRSLFLAYGGHRLAAGCTLARENMAAFRATMNALAEERLDDEALRRKQRIDAPLELSAVDAGFLDAYRLFPPFGVGNPKPVFLASGVEAAAEPRIRKNKHLKALVRQNGRAFEALAWDRAAWAPRFRPGARLDLAFALDLSEYLGRPQVNLVLDDIRTV